MLAARLELVQLKRQYEAERDRADEQGLLFVAMMYDDWAVAIGKAITVLERRMVAA